MTNETQTWPSRTDDQEMHKQPWLNKTPIPALPWLTLEVLIFIVILILAVVTRFYNLGARVMSHDESLHTYFSYNLSQGLGYEHNPMMHGPLQFHLIALSYFTFGSSDFTARIPAALFSIATVALAWLWRRYLGRVGALLAGLMVLISPFLLYYGRYTREDPYVGVSLFLMLYAILRYFDTGEAKYIYLVSGSLVIHYLTKETAYIYNAQILIFLAVYFIVRIIRRPWQDENLFKGFMAALIIGVLLLGATGFLALGGGSALEMSSTQTALPADPNAPAPLAAPAATGISPVAITAALTALAIVVTLYFLFRGFGIENVRKERSFDLLIVFGTLVLPHLSAIPVHLIGWNPLDYSSQGLIRTGMFLLPLALLSIGIGLWWNTQVWWRMALIYWAPYILLYTTIFTNGAGFFTGVVGSLGYWIEQHDVQRGSQPWYYYILITIPIYEFLPALGSLLALYYSFRGAPKQEVENETSSGEEISTLEENTGAFDTRTNLVTLLGWWTFSSIIALSIAGEKMPWLTFHMALPMTLWAGWALNQVVERINWEDFRQRKPILVAAVALVFVLSVAGVFIALLSDPRPFQGSELAQLKATTSFIFAVIGLAASFWALSKLLESWSFKQVMYINLLAFFGILAFLTARASIRANYILYDSAREYLVYAHGFTGVKDVLRQVKDLSEKTTGGMDIVVAYDDDVSWPMSWYMREYPKARFYGASPTRDLRDVPAIIVGDNNFSKIEPIVANQFYRFDYIRMVWPNQDYFGLTRERFVNALTDPALRAAIFDIWLNRDYTRYGEVTGSQSLTDATWEPSDKMRLYIRKDIAAKIWKYGAAPVEAAAQVDPYEKGKIQLSAELVTGSNGSGEGQFNAPREIAFAPDGSYYVADSRNNRIQHFSADGTFISQWGSFGDSSLQSAPPGSFNEPWGVAVGPDGSVYVTDTWNHRVQKFSPSGVSIKVWGVFGLPDLPNALYGPRGIAVDKDGHVYVADTGNKRIVIYDSDGNVLGQFGSEGAEPGQFYEPVDVKLDADGFLYVTDTWNQRIQVFAPLGDGVSYSPFKQWDVAGWFSQSLDNKPYLAIAPNGNVFVTDPEGYRVIEFKNDGTFVQAWGDYGTEDFAFGLPSGIAVDRQGKVWVTDAGNGRVMRFSAPEK
jgi:uncharacterized protein (TIGR03663 family)